MGCKVQQLGRFSNADAGFYDPTWQPPPATVQGGTAIVQGVTIDASTLIVQNELEATVYISTGAYDPSPTRHDYLVPPNTLFVVPVEGLTTLRARAVYDARRFYQAPALAPAPICDNGRAAIIYVGEAALAPFVGPMPREVLWYDTGRTDSDLLTTEYSFCDLGNVHSIMRTESTIINVLARTAATEAMVLVQICDDPRTVFWDVGQFYVEKGTPLLVELGPRDWMRDIIASTMPYGTLVGVRVELLDIVGVGHYDVSTVNRLAAD